MSSMPLPLTLLSLLLAAESRYYSRIANPYHGVYLNSTLNPSPTPTYWILLDNNRILTPDSTHQLCINATKQVSLCSAGSGSLSSAWSYEAGSLGLYTMSGSDKYYLTLDGSGVGVTQQQVSNGDRILFSPAVGDSDTPVVHKLSKVVETLREELRNVREMYGKLSAQKDKMVKGKVYLTNQAKTAEEDYNEKVKMIRERLEKFRADAREMETSMMGAVQKMNNTRNNMVESVLPSISADIENIKIKPTQFLQRLENTDLETYLTTQIAEVNTTLSGYLHKHRIAPVSVYDWLIIVTTLLYVVYFVDIIGRSAGWKCLVKKETVTTELEMEAPTNIQPEYFLQGEDEESNFEFARTRESIKGKLQLKPVE